MSFGMQFLFFYPPTVVALYSSVSLLPKAFYTRMLAVYLGPSSSSFRKMVHKKIAQIKRRLRAMPCKFVRAPPHSFPFTVCGHKGREQQKKPISVSDRAIKNRFSNIRDVDLCCSSDVQLPIHARDVPQRQRQKGQSDGTCPRIPAFRVFFFFFWHLLRGWITKPTTKPYKFQPKKNRKRRELCVVNADTQKPVWRIARTESRKK